MKIVWDDETREKAVWPQWAQPEGQGVWWGQLINDKAEVLGEYQYIKGDLVITIHRIKGLVEPSSAILDTITEAIEQLVEESRARLRTADADEDES